MQRLACVFVVFAAACGSSGPGTGAASLTGVTPAAKSASATSFSGPDGAGTKVLGWKIDFTDSGPGADCASQDIQIVSTIGIYTSMADDGSHKTATLATGDIVIVTTSPPTVAGNAAATMGAMGVNSIVGTVTIGAFHLDAQSHVDHIDGMVNAGGTDGNGAGVAVTGTFVAPVCN